MPTEPPPPLPVKPTVDNPPQTEELTRKRDVGDPAAQIRSVHRPKAQRPHHAPLLKELMMGLLYPAVLGTILYIGLATSIGRIIGGKTPPRSDWPKIALYVLTFVFYCCDYLYVRFTRTYRVWFFIFDVVFIAGLCVTAGQIESVENVWSPALVKIVSIYILFMMLYLIWDYIEKHLCANSPADERRFYDWVITWECLSILALCCVRVLILVQRIRLEIFFDVLVTITIAFAGVVSWKRLFFERVDLG